MCYATLCFSYFSYHSYSVLLARMWCLLNLINFNICYTLILVKEVQSEKNELVQN
jgi:hypothetical protein